MPHCALTRHARCGRDHSSAEEETMRDASQRAECELRNANLLPRLGDYVDLHARAMGNRVAFIEHDTGVEVTWKRFAQASEAFAAKLLSVGLKKGDVVATSLPFLKEHIFLEYACFKLGVIIAPLDLRLKAGEILDAFSKIQPKAYFFLGKTPRADFCPIVKEVMAQAPSVRHFIQFQPEREGVLPGAQHVLDFARDVKRKYIFSLLSGSVRRAKRAVTKRDPALIIFTTGSTGSPKAAMLAHESILVQNIGLAVALAVTNDDRMLVNLPPSHVGGQTEQLMTTIYAGCSSVVLHVFDAEKSLEAIARHKATMCGQIPSLFAMQWRLPNYSSYDLSSLRFAIYGGQAVDRPFLDKLATMAKQMGTGLGLTETAGFCTYTPAEWRPEEVADSIGFDTPLCPISVREPMEPDGKAGAEKPKGEVGDICFSGPQLFLGYMRDPQATARTISTDGFCYTGDLGRVDERGLHFAGRRKFVIKPKGFQVFPGEVENFITDGFKERVASTGCVGVDHQVFMEAIVAFIELKGKASLTREEIEQRLKEIAAYKRPSHYVFLREGEMPINRVAKIDYLELQRRAKEEISKLRAAGKWDSSVPMPA